MDSTRGIAAIIVMIFHTNGYITGNVLSSESNQYLLDKNIKYFIWIIFNGSNAVSYFFVLSGFVLSYKYLKSNSIPDFKSFVIQRILRIYPLFIFVVSVTYWYTTSVPDRRNFIKEILILPDLHKFIPPGWTITIELAISLIIPIIIIVLLTNFKWGKYLLIISLFTTPIFSNFFPHFILGALVCFLFVHHKISKKYHNKIFLLASLLLYSSITILARFPAVIHFLEEAQLFVGLKLSFLDTILPAFASAFFIMYILKSLFLQKLLSFKTLVYFGKISYGIYLIHYFVINCIVSELIKYLPKNNILSIFIVVNILVLSFTITISALLYHTLELPFIQLGKKIIYRNNVLKKGIP